LTGEPLAASPVECGGWRHRRFSGGGFPKKRFAFRHLYFLWLISYSEPKRHWR